MTTSATNNSLEEVFLLPLTRAELDLVEGEVSVMYAIELAKHHPDFQVITGDGIESYPEWLARLGAREAAKKLSHFLSTHGLEGIRELEAKLSKLQRGVQS